MRPKHDSITHLLRRFWQELATLPDLLKHDEQLLAAACTATLRQNVLEMMLALNGIAYPHVQRTSIPILVRASALPSKKRCWPRL